MKEAQDFSAIENTFMGDIHAAVASEERRKIAERLVGGRRERSKRDGMGSGSVPYGFTRIGKGRESTIAIDESAADIILFILASRDDGMTYDQIACHLTSEGYRTSRGETWTRGQVKRVDDRRALYQEGRKGWGDVESEEAWPIICSTCAKSTISRPYPG
jgi:DNA invertase Pin-like site-specific DNA recombinase